MRRIISLLLCFMMIITAVSCTTETSGTSSYGTSASDNNGVYEFNPHVYSSLYDENFDAATKESFFSFCDAVLAGEEEFDCPDSVTFYNVTETIAHNCMPLATYFVTYDDLNVKNGKGHIQYNIPKEEYLSRVEGFKDIVNSMLEECIRPGFDDVDKALALYRFFEEHYIYDYSDLDGVCLSSYRLFYEQKGICQEIAPAYAYMLLQAGVDCTTCGSLNDINESHEWVLAKLNGKYYHIDPTWVISDPQTLRYFGMTDDERVAEGGWEKEFFNYGEANIFDTRGEYNADDTTFAPLWDSVSYEVDYDNNVISYYRISDGTHETLTY